MQTKTISKVISKKVNDWLSSINDESLRKELKNKIIVTGGCIASMLMDEPVNDYDIYLTDKNIVKRVSQYYCDIFNERNKNRVNKLGKTGIAWVLDGEDVEKWKNNKLRLTSFAVGYCDDTQFKEGNVLHSGVSGMITNTPEDRIKIIINSDGIAKDSDVITDNTEYDIEKYIENVEELDEQSIEKIEEIEKKDKEKYIPIFLSTNAITLSDKIQIVIRFYGDAEEIHKNYDFVHCTGYWTSEDGKVHVTAETLEALMNKVLIYRGSKYPIASLIRTRKFIKRGFHINAGQYLKMAFQINKLDLSNIYVLEDQLVGVDSIYFLDFIDHMRRSIEAGNDIDITGDYVLSVIDKIFG